MHTIVAYICICIYVQMSAYIEMYKFMYVIDALTTLHTHIINIINVS